MAILAVVLSVVCGSDAAGADLEKICFDRGEEMLRARRFADAAKQFETVVGLNPNRPDVYYRLGLCLGRLGQAQKAVRALNRSLYLDPGNAMALKLTDAYSKRLGGSVLIEITRTGVSPTSVAATGKGTLVIQAAVRHKGGNSKILKVSADLESIALGFTKLHDDGKSPDRKAGDGIFSAGVIVPKTVTSGQHSIGLMAFSSDYDVARSRLQVAVFKAGGYTVTLHYQNATSVEIGPGVVAFDGGVLKNPTSATVGLKKLDTGDPVRGTDYYVYAVVTPGTDMFQAIVSASSVGPNGFSRYKLLGYFHYGPDSSIIPASVVTNDNLDGTTLAAGIPLPGMVQVGDFAMDIYENTIDRDGLPVSRHGAIPWTLVSAQKITDLAKKIGKRLPTAAEWYQAAKGTPDPHREDPGGDNEPCNIWRGSIPGGAVSRQGAKNIGSLVHFGAIRTGTAVKSVSSIGCFDMIGNVWEWTTDRVVAYDRFKHTYVTAVDEAGLPVATGKAPSAAYNYDGVDTYTERLNLLFTRGGAHDDGALAGLYAVNIRNAVYNGDAKVGFRLTR